MTKRELANKNRTNLERKMGIAVFDSAFWISRKAMIQARVERRLKRVAVRKQERLEARRLNKPLVYSLR